MDTYHKITEQPLTPKERAKLKRGVYIIPVFMVIFGFAMAFFWSTIEWSVNNPLAYFLGFLFSLIIFIFMLISFHLYRDLSEDVKLVFQGIVTGKIDKSSKIAGKSNFQKDQYYLYFGDHEKKVDVTMYKKFEPGDLIEIHLAKHSYQVYFQSKLIKRTIDYDQLAKEYRAETSKNE